MRVVFGWWWWWSTCAGTWRRCAHTRTRSHSHTNTQTRTHSLRDLRPAAECQKYPGIINGARVHRFTFTRGRSTAASRWHLSLSTHACIYFNAQTNGGVGVGVLARPWSYARTRTQSGLFFFVFLLRVLFCLPPVCAGLAHALHLPVIIWLCVLTGPPNVWVGKWPMAQTNALRVGGFVGRSHN